MQAEAAESALHEPAASATAAEGPPCLYHEEVLGAEVVEGVDRDMHLLNVMNESNIADLVEKIDGAHAGSSPPVRICDVKYQTEGLEEIFGPNWKADLRGCTRDELEDCKEEPDLDDPSLHRLLDDAESLSLEVAAERGIQLSSLQMEERDRIALLSSLDAKQLLTKIIARNRRRALDKARSSEAMRELTTALAGRRGTAPCLDAIERRHPDIGDKIDKICEQLDIGADSHRYSGCLIMNSATKREKGTGGNMHHLLRIRTRLPEKRSQIADLGAPRAGTGSELAPQLRLTPVGISHLSKP